MNTWEPIETAPKDGTLIDFWCVDPMGEFIPENGGVRLTDCFWYEEENAWGRMLDDGNISLVEGPYKNYIDLPAWKPILWMKVELPPK